MRTYLGAENIATLQNFARYATSFLKFQQGSNTSGLTIQAESHSRQKTSKNNNPDWCQTDMSPCANKHSTKSLSSSEEAPTKSLDHSKRRSPTPKINMTPQEHVVSITLQIQAPQ